MRLRSFTRNAVSSLACSALVLAVIAMPVVPALASVDPVPVIDVKKDCDENCQFIAPGAQGCANGTCKNEAQKQGCGQAYCSLDPSDDTKCACRK